jgi:hypothetical protein
MWYRRVFFRALRQSLVIVSSTDTTMLGNIVDHHSATRLSSVFYILHAVRKLICIQEAKHDVRVLLKHHLPNRVFISQPPRASIRRLLHLGNLWSHQQYGAITDEKIRSCALDVLHLVSAIHPTLLHTDTELTNSVSESLILIGLGTGCANYFALKRYSLV